MSHLTRIDRRYYYRARVPVDLLCLFGRAEIRKSLRTGNYRKARYLASELDYRLEVIHLVARIGLLTDEQTRQLVNRYFHQTLQASEELRALGEGVPKDGEELERKVRFHENAIKARKQALTFNRFDSTVSQVIRGLLSQDGADITEPLDYAKLSREIVKAQLQISEIEIERINGNYDNWYDREFRRRAAADAESAPKGSTLLSDVIRLHIQEKVSTGKWTPKTQQENEAIYRIFLGALGDIEIARLGDRKVFLDYLQTLSILPANLNKKPEYRGKTLRKVLEMVRKHPATPLMIRTRNKHMERVSTLMDWAAENGYVSRNFARGLLVKEEREDDEKRDPYSREDLMRLFSSPVYTTNIPFRWPERFWAPLISPFSGLRQNEICQLYTDDICTIDDIPCFNINDDKDKRLKTPASKRTIPIHPVLIRVGFLRFVEEQRRQGQARLWPRLSKGRNGYSTTFEHWYSLYNRKHVSVEKEKVFHSGRHTVSHTLKNAGVDIEIREAILGHEEDALSRRYGKKFRPAILLKALKKLNYDDVAEHLKWP